MNVGTTIGKTALFKGLSPSELTAVSELARTRTYEAGEPVFAEGGYGDDVCVLVKGMIRIELSVGDASDSATVHRFSAGQVFGEMALADRRNRSAAATCESDCEILAIPCADLLVLFDANHDIGYRAMRNLAEILATRLRKTNSQLVNTFLWE
jgi:CRP/FNR family cyclic AMP-dependent transcriptional regulator